MLTIDDRSPRHLRVLFLACLAIALAAGAPSSALAADLPDFAGSGSATRSFIDYVELTGLFDPASADFLSDQIGRSEDSGSSALVVRVDSPGSVGVSVGRIIGRMMAARVPIVVWVAPGAAQAHSVAAFMVAAADVAVMAPSATIGPASAEAVVNSSTPASRRNQERRALGALIEAGVNRQDTARLKRSPISAAQAQQSGLIDFRAASLQRLLEGLGGRRVEAGGEARALPEGPFVPRFHKMSLLGRLMHGAVRAPAAYLLLLGGVFALLFELYNPGVGGAAVAGGIALGFSLYGLSILPTAWLPVGLVLAGLALLTADLQVSRLGGLTAAGLGALLFGSGLMFAAAPAAMRLPWWAIAAGTAATLAFYFSVMPAAIRSRIARPLAGAENIVGTLGVARTDVAPEGQVMARGTLWRARTLGAAIAQGSQVEIKGVAGLTLMVEPAGQHVPEPEDHPAGE